MQKVKDAGSFAKDHAWCKKERKLNALDYSGHAELPGGKIWRSYLRPLFVFATLK